MEVRASENVAEGVKRGLVVTARDKHLLAFLALARLLTTKQLADLSFPGRHLTIVARRLRALEARGVARAPYVRQLKHGTLDGRVVITWALADAGFVLAERLL